MQKFFNKFYKGRKSTEKFYCPEMKKKKSSTLFLISNLFLSFSERCPYGL